MRFERESRESVQRRMNIVVHMRQKLTDCGAPGRCERRGDLGFPLQPMRDHRIDDRDRLVQHATMTRRNGERLIGLETAKRFDIRAHVAVGRNDHRRHAVQHVIA